MGCIVSKQDETVVIDAETVKNTRANRKRTCENQLFAAGEVQYQYDHPISILDLRTPSKTDINQRKRRPSIQFIDCAQTPKNSVSKILEPFQHDHAVGHPDSNENSDAPSMQRKRRSSAGFVDSAQPQGVELRDVVWPHDGESHDTTSSLTLTFSCMTVKCDLYSQICTTDPALQVKNSLGTSKLPRQETEGSTRKRLQPLPASILQSFAKTSLHLCL
jgi:hypothetical protein